MKQRQEVSKVLVQGAQETSEKENISGKGNGPVPVSSSSNVFGSIFSGVNCTINISPHTFSINVCSAPQVKPDIDINALFGIDMEMFLS